MSAVTSSQRHSKAHPCKICGGWDGLERGQGKRCSGYLGHDGLYEHCSREEHAGRLDPEMGGTYAHKLEGACKCGVTHGARKVVADDVEVGRTNYDYYTADGVLHCRVIKIQFAGGKKTFRQCRPEGNGWVWKFGDLEKIPYRLPELLASTDRVWVVEGEKDVETARSLGLTATTNIGGGNGWKGTSIEWLRGREVVIVADADIVGRKAAKLLAERLEGVAVSARIVECPGYKDLSDWVAAGATRDRIEGLLSEKPKESPKLIVIDGGRKEIKLLLNSEKKPLKCAENVARLLAEHPAWRGGPRLDTYRREVAWPEGTPLGAARALHDTDHAAVQGWLLAQAYDLCVETGLGDTWAGIELAASRSSFDSLLSFVESLPAWDGTPRPLENYLRASNDAVTSAVCRRWLLGAMACAYKPGTSFGGMLVLEGAQETYKNRGLEALFGQEHVAILGQNRGRDAEQIAESSWLVHDDEFSQNPKDLDALKSFLVKTKHTYVAKYSKVTSHNLRRAVFAASTNHITYLEDEENRRFWPVKIGQRGGLRVDVEGLARDRLQIWGEVKAAYKAGEKWWVDPDEDVRVALRGAQADRVTEDPLTHDVRQAIVRLLLLERLTTHQIMEKLCISVEKRDRPLEQRLGRILRDLGYARRKFREGDRTLNGYEKAI